MLLQSHAKQIEFLPALPKAEPNGSVKRLRARGGFEVDMIWKEGQLTKAVVRSTQGLTFKLRYNDQVIEKALKIGESVEIDFSRGLFFFRTIL